MKLTVRLPTTLHQVLKERAVEYNVALYLLSLPTYRLAAPVLGGGVGEKLTLVCVILTPWAAPRAGARSKGEQLRFVEPNVGRHAVCQTGVAG